MKRRAVNSNAEAVSIEAASAQELTTTFSALERATVGIDAVAGALGELGAAVDGAARSANMKRRELLAGRYATLRENIATLEAARKRELRELVGSAGNNGSGDPEVLGLVAEIDGFRDTALIEAARDSIAKAKESLDRAAGTYREHAAKIADQLVALGENITRDKDGTAQGGDFDDPLSKRPSLGSRLLRGLLGNRAA